MTTYSDVLKKAMYWQVATVALAFIALLLIIASFEWSHLLVSGWIFLFLSSWTSEQSYKTQLAFWKEKYGQFEIGR